MATKKSYNFFCLLFQATFTSFSKKKSQKDVTKQLELMDLDLDSGGPEIYGFYGSDPGSATLLKTHDVMLKL